MRRGERGAVTILQKHAIAIHRCPGKLVVQRAVPSKMTVQERAALRANTIEERLLTLGSDIL